MVLVQEIQFMIGTFRRYNIFKIHLIHYFFLIDNFSRKKFPMTFQWKICQNISSTFCANWWGEVFGGREEIMSIMEFFFFFWKYFSSYQRRPWHKKETNIFRLSQLVTLSVSIYVPLFIFRDSNFLILIVYIWTSNS